MASQVKSNSCGKMRTFPREQMSVSTWTKSFRSLSDFGQSSFPTRKLRQPLLLLEKSMGNESAIVFSGIAPHPPIMVPEVGGEAIADVRGSIDAMGELTRRIIESGAETVVLISPHAPLDPHGFVAYHSPKLSGDFANFRAPNARVEFTSDENFLEAITGTAGERNYEVMNLENYPLDHGSAVPLYFLDRNGWSGRVVVLGYS